MRFSIPLTVSASLCALSIAVHAQGLPPRVAPTDYASHGKAGSITIAAEFTVRSSFRGLYTDTATVRT
mgnify:CR=1 FL=1